jgi:hypothetical protein
MIMRNYAALLLLLTAALYQFALAFLPSQQQTGFVPTIIAFSADLPALPLEDTEAGETPVVLAWYVVQMSEAYHLRLDSFRVNQWESLLETDEMLTASGTRTLFVTHPLNFGAPTYRLSLLDGDDSVLDERTVVITYEIDSAADTPSIASFVTSARDVEAEALAYGSARVPVAWEVASRLPTANLRFEQVMDDGSTVSIELPRPNRWVSSSGEGVVAPILPGEDNPVRLRLRLEDEITGETYDQAQLTLPVVGVVSTVTPSRSAPVATLPAPGPQIIAFTASPNPAARGGSVTLSWDVRGQTRLSIAQRTPAMRLPQEIASGIISASGTMNVPLTGDTFANAESVSFILRVEGSGGQPADRTVVVQIVDGNAAPQVTSFTTSTGSIQPGGGITINWQAAGTTGVVVEILDMASGAVARVIRGLPAAGTAEIAMPATLIGTARLTIWPVNQPQEDAANPLSYRQGTSSSLDVRISQTTCPYVFFTPVGAGGCPAGEARTIQAAFEPFENGMMVWRGDTGTVYVLHNNGDAAAYAESVYAGLPDAQVSETPPGLLQPVSGFGRVWANLPGVRDRVGWAAAAEQGYTMTIQDVAVSPNATLNYTVFFTLPDGRVVGMAGTDRWNIVAS